jgi:hypothetical protein
MAQNRGIGPAANEKQLRNDMATKLEKTLKREIDVDGKAYMLAISPEGLKLTEKGRRKGQELSWKGVLNGQAAAPSAQGGGTETETATEEE